MIIVHRLSRLFKSSLVTVYVPETWREVKMVFIPQSQLVFPKDDGKTIRQLYQGNLFEDESNTPTPREAVRKEVSYRSHCGL